MKEISEIFENLKSDYNKVCNVEIETPYVLSSSQLKELGNYLKLKYKSQIKINQVISKELIAGIKIKVNNEVTDLSIRNRLEHVTQHLMM
jgi:ATP synthase F1 delta subunit